MLATLSAFTSFLLAGLLATPAAADLGDDETKTVTLRVRAVDACGEPIRGAVVRVWKSDPYTGSGRIPVPELIPPDKPGADPVRTADAGLAQLTITLPPKATINVELAATGRASAWTGWQWVYSLDSDAVTAITLRRLRSVSGRVLDRQQRPVADAEVFQTGDSHERTSTRTDADGRFELAGVPEGGTFLFARRDGFRFHGRLVTDADRSADLMLTRSDEPVPPLRSLPFELSRDEELRLARRVGDACWNEAAQTGNREFMHQTAWWYHWLDPFAVMEQQKDYSRFWLAPTLYARSPDEAFAELEAMPNPDTRSKAYLRIFRFVPAASRSPRRELLERALKHALAVETPEVRSDCISGVIVRLVDLGETDRARRLVEDLHPIAETFEDEDSRGRFAEALGFFDPQAALRFLEATKWKEDSERYHFRLAYRLADREPAVADELLRRIQAEATEHGWPSSFSDIKAVAVCYRMAAVDVDRALRIAERMGDPHQQAYARGMIALRLAEQDRPRAAALIEQAFAGLEQATRSAQPATSPDRAMVIVPAAPVAAALLPVAELIDPALVEECLWRTVALRLPQAVGVNSARADLFAAPLVARYNRTAAATILEPYLASFARGAEAGPARSHGTMIGVTLATLDPRRGESVIAALPPSPGLGQLDPKYGLVWRYIELLARPQPLRWPLATVLANLWSSDEEAMDDFNLVW